MYAEVWIVVLDVILVVVSGQKIGRPQFFGFRVHGEDLLGDLKGQHLRLLHQVVRVSDFFLGKVLLEKLRCVKLELTELTRGLIQGNPLLHVLCHDLSEDLPVSLQLPFLVLDELG